MSLQTHADEATAFAIEARKMMERAVLAAARDERETLFAVANHKMQQSLYHNLRDIANQVEEIRTGHRP